MLGRPSTKSVMQISDICFSLVQLQSKSMVVDGVHVDLEYAVLITISNSFHLPLCHLMYFPFCFCVFGLFIFCFTSEVMPQN